MTFALFSAVKTKLRYIETIWYIEVKIAFRSYYWYFYKSNSFNITQLGLHCWQKGKSHRQIGENPNFFFFIVRLYHCFISLFWVLFTILVYFLWYRDKKITLKVLGSQGILLVVYTTIEYIRIHRRLSIGVFMGTARRLTLRTNTYTYSYLHVCSLTIIRYTAIFLLSFPFSRLS